MCCVNLCQQVVRKLLFILYTSVTVNATLKIKSKLKDTVFPPIICERKRRFPMKTHEGRKQRAKVRQDIFLTGFVLF